MLKRSSLKFKNYITSCLEITNKETQIPFSMFD